MNSFHLLIFLHLKIETLNVLRLRCASGRNALWWPRIFINMIIIIIYLLRNFQLWFSRRAVGIIAPLVFAIERTSIFIYRRWASLACAVCDESLGLFPVETSSLGKNCSGREFNLENKNRMKSVLHLEKNGLCTYVIRSPRILWFRRRRLQCAHSMVMIIYRAISLTRWSYSWIFVKWPIEEFRVDIMFSYVCRNWAIQITYSHFDLIDCWLCIRNINGSCFFFSCSSVIHPFSSLVSIFSVCRSLAFFRILAMMMAKIVITCTRHGKNPRTGDQPSNGHTRTMWERREGEIINEHCAFIAACGHNKLWFVR